MVNTVAQELSREQIRKLLTERREGNVINLFNRKTTDSGTPYLKNPG
jgi:hypothetical protein